MAKRSLCADLEEIAALAPGYCAFKTPAAVIDIAGDELRFADEVVHGALPGPGEFRIRVRLCVIDRVATDDAREVTAEVLGKAFRGAEFLYTLRLASGATVLSLVPSHHNHAIGERIGIRLELDHVVAFKREGVAREGLSAAPALDSALDCA